MGWCIAIRCIIYNWMYIQTNINCVYLVIWALMC